MLHFLDHNLDKLYQAPQSWKDMFSGMGDSSGFKLWGWPEARQVFFTIPVGSGWSDDAFRLRFIIPGVEHRNFELISRGDRVILRGKREKPELLRDSEQFDFAMPYGRFERSVSLPIGLAPEKMKARFHEGVLDVWIPLRDDAVPRLIPITVGATMEPAAAVS